MPSIHFLLVAAFEQRLSKLIHHNSSTVLPNPQPCELILSFPMAAFNWTISCLLPRHWTSAHLDRNLKGLSIPESSLLECRLRGVPLGALARFRSRGLDKTRRRKHDSWAHKEIADSQFAFQMRPAHPTLIMSSSTNVNSNFFRLKPQVWCGDEDLESHLAE